MSRSTETLQVEGMVKKETEKAILMDIEQGDNIVSKWIPRSQIREIDMSGNTDIVTITKWIADKLEVY